MLAVAGIESSKEAGADADLRSALLLLFCENRFRLLRFGKHLNSTKRGVFFWTFCVSKVMCMCMRTKLFLFSELIQVRFFK